MLLKRERQDRRLRQQRQANRLLLEGSLAEFIRQAWHVVEPATPLEWGRHIDAVCLHLEAVTRGQLKNLLITIPPGSSKSLAVCVFWPAWTWATQPSLRWLFAANDEGLVIRDAVACRRLVESEWYRDLWGDSFSLTSDQNVKSWYENSKRGWRTSTTVNGAVTGKKGDCLVVDDPHDARRVASDVERTRVHDWWDQAFYNRVNDHRTGRRVVIAQRTHPDDLIGHLLAQGGYEELRLPEEFEPETKCKTSIGWEDWRTAPGELLRPSRFGPEQVAEARIRLRAAGYSAQHQQRPVPGEGNRFKKEWLKRYTFENKHFGQGGEVNLAGKRYLMADCWTFQTCDPAASAATVAKKNDPDYTVVSTWLVTPDHHLVWLDCHRFRLDIPDIVPQLEQAYSQWRPQYLAIEAVASNRAVYQLACRTHMIVKEVSPKGQDKLIRATPAIVLAESGRLWLPDRAHWLHDAEEELLAFTGDPKRDRKDDIVDTLSYACSCLEEHDDGSSGRPFAVGSRGW